MADKCQKCGEAFGEAGDWDGYCIDCWPGYDLCANPLCRHYRCEHGLGVLTAVWAKDPADVGSQMDLGQGCANADCPCECFVEESLPIS